MVFNPFSALSSYTSPQHSDVQVAEVAASTDPDSTVKISLKTISTAESYECISYDRSREHVSRTIYLDGSEYSIPQPLEAAIKALRRKEKPRYVWADLLLGSSPEIRNAQTSQLKSVLEGANNVVAWIGEGDSRTQDAFGVIRTLANRWHAAAAQANLPRQMKDWNTNQMSEAQQKILSYPVDALYIHDKPLWESVRKAYAADYFLTVQAVPELVLAKKTIIAAPKISMTFDDFHMAFRALFMSMPAISSEVDPQDFMAAFKQIGSLDATIARYHKSGLELHALLLSARGCRTNDPREHVFSMLPVTTPSQRTEKRGWHGVKQPVLVADYTKTAEEVLLEATKYMLLERQDFLIWWNEKPPCTRRKTSLPSWVPDWTDLDLSNQVFNVPNNGLREWTDHVANKKQIRVEEGTIYAQACALDTLETVSPILTPQNIRRQALNLWQSFVNRPGMAKDEKWTAVWTTLVVNNFGVGEQFSSVAGPTAEISNSFQSLIAEERLIQLVDCSPEELQSNPAMQEKMRNLEEAQVLGPLTGKSGQFDALLRRNSVGRRFFITSKGRVGMTSIEDVSQYDGGDLGGLNKGAKPLPTAAERSTKPGAMSGDIIVALVGGFSPYIMRPNNAAAQAGLNDALVGDHFKAMLEQFQQHLVDKGDAQAADVVREHFDPSKNESEYEFVGECYYHGAMQGECFKTEASGWLGGARFKTDTPLVDIKIV